VTRLPPASAPLCSRRPLLLGAAVLSYACACRKGTANSDDARDPALATSALLPSVLTPVPPIPDGGVGARGQVRLETWTLHGDGRAVVLLPAWSKPNEKLPLLLAFHGRGEALKGPSLGVFGWPKDYALPRAIERISAPPLTPRDFEGMVDKKRLANQNAELSARPFEGLVIVCPYAPDVDLRKPGQIRAYSEYVMNVVVPRAKRELPVLGSPPSLGIDGVSLGGALALRIGLANPTAFGALGTLQPAIGEDQVEEYSQLVQAARKRNPNLALRLLTSDQDYFRRAIQRLSASLRTAKVDHTLVEIPGVHDYPFNRGPGAIEMLLWHDSALSRSA
jgi:enterochelin esterase-like enzyme